MGDITGIGTAVAGAAQAAGTVEAANIASKTALTGYNYLKGNPVNQQAQGAGSTALTAQGPLQAQESALLTSGAGTPAATSAFNNYLNSTGYKFQLDQGRQAITGSAAARGLLGSGATAKALTSYGQGLAGNYFNNYLNQLSGLNSQYQTSANAGTNAAANVAGQGTTGGGNAGSTQASGFGSAAGQVGGIVNSLTGNFLNGPGTSGGGFSYQDPVNF